jgi:osmotically-inducible protein OsmY
MKRLLSIAFIAGLGAWLASFFLDPQSGKRRRKTTVDRAGAYVRRGQRGAGRAGRAVVSEAYGLKQKAAHAREQEKPQPDDVTLAHKVETEIFRDPGVPKGQINVNAEDGVVYLRGEVERTELIHDLEEATRKVQGVRGVENLLHVPGAPAPQKLD